LTEIPKLLTKMEVARILRCFPSKVIRLRKAGRIAYIPGRPVFIYETDVIAYLESMKIAAVHAKRPEQGPPAGSEGEAIQKACMLARKNALRRNLRSKEKRTL
jgi:hypothetical protein